MCVDLCACTCVFVCGNVGVLHARAHVGGCVGRGWDLGQQQSLLSASSVHTFTCMDIQRKTNENTYVHM